MKLLYLDCFAGISGDMLLGALLDLGVSEDALRSELAKLKLPGYTISTRRVVKQNIEATKFDCIEVTSIRSAHHRGYTEIAGMITDSGLSAKAKRRALNVFKRIGEAEAKIHGVPLDSIHFHEVGAVDSIVDIVGTCVAIEMLGADEIQASPVPLGSGFVETAHGRFPVPAPATLELLKGIPTQSANIAMELVTPTGAALMAEFCAKFAPIPAVRVEKIGYGAGSRDLDKTPNVLRAILGQVTGAENDVVAIIETNIDDMNPELFGDVMERVLAAGALDVFWTPVQMKKNRPGTLVTVLCEREATDRLVELLLRQTTSFGVRIHEAYRRKLTRAIVKVPTRYGEIECKIGRLNAIVVQRSPEFEACKRAAAQAGVAVREVYNEAARAAGDIQ
ncbi:MAG: Pyridinium-3,5-bisthiocarboxylic acid mononucleotide nickel insertion protein [Verrucomicrobiae bacterium]|nr:Pyridinium-3,5-bisthiocarboxylic acid mononucleotide nickel insertion protein [Verrucomicrobiae bacterium]